MIFYGALAGFAVLFSYLAWRNMPLALALLVSFLPAYLIRFVIVVPATVLELMILIVIVVWVLKNYKVGIRLPPAFFPFRFPLLIFLLASLAALIAAPDTVKAAGLWRAYFFEPIFLFLIFVDQIRTKEQIRQVIAGAAVSVLVLSVVAIYQKFTGWILPYPWYDPAMRRVTSFFPYPNALALYLVPFLSLILAAIKIWKPSRWLAVLLILSLGTGLIALFFTKSAGGLLGMAAAIIFVAATHPARKKLLAVLLALSFLFTVLIASVPGWRTQAWQIITLQETSSQVRLALWYGTGKLLFDNPLLGAGLAGFPTLYDKYRLARHTELLLHPHNILLNFWVELGLLGLISFVWLIAIAFKLWRSDKLALLPAMAGLIALIVHGLFDVPYFKNDLAIQFWLILALFLALAGPACMNFHTNNL